MERDQLEKSGGTFCQRVNDLQSKKSKKNCSFFMLQNAAMINLPFRVIENSEPGIDK